MDCIICTRPLEYLEYKMRWFKLKHSGCGKAGKGYDSKETNIKDRLGDTELIWRDKEQVLAAWLFRSTSLYWKHSISVKITSSTMSIINHLAACRKKVPHMKMKTYNVLKYREETQVISSHNFFTVERLQILIGIYQFHVSHIRFQHL